MTGVHSEPLDPTAATATDKPRRSGATDAEDRSAAAFPVGPAGPAGPARKKFGPSDSTPARPKDYGASELGILLGPSQLAVAESCTAGRICQTVVGIVGSGSWFQGGMVAYHERTKREVLGVSVASVLSEAAALEMAGGIAALLDADVAVATTGVTGPEPVEGVRPGTVVIATQVGATGWVATHHYRGDSAAIVEQAVEEAFSQLAAHLRNQADHEDS